MNRECGHLTLHDHSVVSHIGRRLWTCSLCRRTGPWEDDWAYFGNVECKRCGFARIDYVLCSSACAEELRSTLGLTLEDYPNVSD